MTRRRIKYSHKQRKTQHLKQTDREHDALPAKSEADDPNGQRPARICERARRRAYMARHAQPKEVEQRNADANREARVEHRWGRDHLCPSAWEIKEGREVGDSR